MLLQFIINGLISGLLYSLLAIGFALVYNTTKVFHLAAAGLYIVAAYMFYSAVSLLHFPVPLGAIFAILITMGVSVLIDLLVYRPLVKRHSTTNVSLIAAVGLLTILVNLIVLLYGNAPKVVENSLKSTYTFGNLILSQPQAWQAGIGILFIGAFIIFIHKTSWGKRFRALSDDDVLFSTLGYSIKGTRNVVFLISGAFIAISSCLNVYEVGMDPNMGMNILINAMAAMIIGGIGRFDACVLGGITLGLIQSLVLIYLPSAWQAGVTFLILMLFLFFRPQGIAGYKQRTV
jgi:branched-subunit amino acid ABC-type transport system permease component